MEVPRRSVSDSRGAALRAADAEVKAAAAHVETSERLDNVPLMLLCLCSDFFSGSVALRPNVPGLFIVSHFVG